MVARPTSLASVLALLCQKSQAIDRRTRAAQFLPNAFSSLPLSDLQAKPNASPFYFSWLPNIYLPSPSVHVLVRPFTN